MKRLILLFGSLFFFLSAFSQNADSLLAAKQVDSLIQISRALTKERDFDKALEVNAAAEKIALEKLGRASVAYSNCCHLHGIIMYYSADYPEAEKWWLETKAIRERVLGKEHPAYEKSLTNLAILYVDMGKFSLAESCYLEARVIREKMVGKEHPDYAQNLNSLAILYWYMGDFETAEPLYLEARTIREKVLGKEHPEYAKSQNNLAILYRDMGRYETAEPLYLEAIAIREKGLGKEHPEFAESLNNLANLYSDMGNYKEAERLFLENIAIVEKVYFKEHPQYAGSLNNLALLYSTIGKFEKAEPLFLEANAIQEKVLGREHPNFATGLNNLALLHLRTGNYEKAEPLFLEAKTIQEKALGKEHSDFALSLYNLAVLYKNMGNYEKSKRLLLESNAIWEKALGREHPNYADILNNLAMLYWYMGNYEKAEPLYQELSAVNKILLGKAVHHLSERELDSYLNIFSESQNQTLSFTQLSGNNNVSPACYDNCLFYKGFLLNAAGQVKRLALSDSGSTEKFKRLKGYHRRLAVQYALPITGRDSTTIAELEEKANKIEKDLARTVTGYGEAMRQINWQDVQQKLKTGEAAVEFVHYRYRYNKQTDSIMYAALLLRPGDMQPLFVPIFEEKQLAALLQSAGGKEKSDLFAGLYASRGVKPVRAQNLANIFELVWKPLENYLAGVKKIYYSPAGMLHRLNLGAIPIERDRTLSDKYELIELGSTRQLVVPGSFNFAANDAMLFGGLKYDSDTAAASLADTLVVGFQSAAFQPEMAARDLAHQGETWDFLPGTENEIASVGKQLQEGRFAVQTFRNTAGTEEAFKLIGLNGPSPRVLHIATHGFFFPDPELNPQSDEPVFKLSDHPMLRSGLILAGGNHAWATGKPLKPGLEDGILTAYEISQMNLSNTELVVLSACETGLGDIQGNEGVYGLQRAFKIAGAKYLIMSLWQVPDKQTSLLMTTFYKKWLEEKMAIPKAFRAAQRELREAGLDPYEWAGFVLVE